MCFLPHVSAVALVLLGLTSRAAALPVPADHDCMGRWVGLGRNTGHAEPWTIDLTLTSAPSGGRCGTIEYTNPACGGTLEECELVGEDIHTREAYTHADPNCAPAGRVIIRCEGDQMRYSWLGWERVDTILRRPEGATSAPQPTTRDEPSPPVIPSNPPPRPSTGPAPTHSPTPRASGCSGCSTAATGEAPPMMALVFLVIAARARRTG